MYKSLKLWPDYSIQGSGSLGGEQTLYASMGWEGIKHYMQAWDGVIQIKPGFTYTFKTGKEEWQGKRLRMGDKDRHREWWDRVRDRERWEDESEGKE